MNYELAEQLKDAGFKQGSATGDHHDGGKWIDSDGDITAHETGFEEECYIPTLEELIEACGTEITSIYRADKAPEGRVWVAKCCERETHVGIGSTPTEAVARLYLQLKKGNSRAAARSQQK